MRVTARTGRPWRGFLRPLQRRLGGERGSTLVAVIGIAAVISVVILTLVSSVVFAIGQTTSARANVSAKAASEAGIETAAAQVAGGVCWVGGTGSSTSPSWKAQVQRLTSPLADPAVEASWVNGCPSAGPVGSPTTFRIISTGKTGIKGSGNSAGDVSTIVAQFTVVQRPSTPEFNQAIFGKSSASANTNLVVNGSTGDVLTGTFNCSTNGRIEGGVYVNSSLSETSTLNTSCQIMGDLITKGNLDCPSVGQIHGNIVVAGNLLSFNTTCHAYKNVMVGGKMSCPATAAIDGDLTVVGDLSLKSGCTIGGNLYVGGNLTLPNDLTVPGNIWVKGNLIGSNNSITSTSGTIRIGGSLSGTTAAKLHATTAPVIGDTSLPAPTPPNMDTYFVPGDPTLNFPKLTPTDARWSGWTQRKWTNDVDPLRSATWINSCDPWGTFTGPLVISTPTIYDLTAATGSGGCGATTVGLGEGLTIKMYADAVLFVKAADLRPSLKVVSADGAKHSLYIVSPWPTGLSTCNPSDSGHTINISASGDNGIVQGANTQVMIYTPGKVASSGSVSLTGQMYGCTVDLATSVTLNFTAANSGGASAGRAFVVTERFRMDNAALKLS